MNRDLPRDPVARHLDSHERIVWRQQAPALRLAASKAPGLVFALAWAGFAWGWTTLVVGALLPTLLRTGFPGVLTIFPWMFFGMGALFSTVGAWLVWTVLTDIAASWATFYVLTDRRLMIVSGRSALDFGAEAFDGARINGNRLSGSIQFAWGRVGRSSAYRATLVGLQEPARIAALVRTTLKR